MKRTKNIILIVTLLAVFSSCIEFFHPDLGSQDKTKYVVDGLITDQEGFQTVFVSMTSTFNNPSFTPLSYCNVKIIDNAGNVFQLDESKGGVYRAWIGKEYLVPGNSYQVNVLTPSGVEIVSDFDRMPECPEIDSIYFARKDYPLTIPDSSIEGIKFYIDFDRKSTNSRFFRWEVVETWEHHAVYPITWQFVPIKGWVNNFPPDYSRFTCWTTERLKEIYTLSTKNMEQPKYTMNSLHYVDNQTQKLTFGYSALISQFSISEPAYTYWEQLRVNSTKQGGLYQTQPLSIKGNLRCTANPDLVVLGFFSAASVRSKRIFVRNLENFDVNQPVCVPPHLPPTGSIEPHKYEIEINRIRYILNDACVECDYMSGTTVKPNFWPY